MVSLFARLIKAVMVLDGCSVSLMRARETLEELQMILRANADCLVEVDFYGGIRPTFGKLAFDFGVWDYYYPGGRCFNTPAFCGFATAMPLPNGNLVKQNESFYAGYGKATYTVNNNFNSAAAAKGHFAAFRSDRSAVG
jgi:hypothetical protein